MSARKVKTEIYTYDFIGIVEEINDHKNLGRVKVRIERLHGRLDDEKHIPTEDLPWCDTTAYGKSFGFPSVGKVVKVAFENDDIYKPSIVGDVHYDINLQEKLDSLDDAKYAEFYAMTYDDKHQYFHDKDEGIMFDYVKSNINMRTNGDIRVNLRDNSSNLYLGTEDASQQAVLGNHFMEWMDEFIQNLLGTNAGPYNGNLGAPIIPNPKMLEVLNKYLALRETFLSDHVYIVDDQQVKPQDREFDVSQRGDNYNDENFEKVNKIKTSGHQAEDRPPVGGNGADSNAPANNFSNNLSSSKLPEDATPDELARNVKPFDDDNITNGNIPVEQMTSNKRLRNQFSDERQYLLDEPSKALDSFLDAYDKEKESSWGRVEVTKGYHNFERQENNRKQFPQSAPLAGKDPFGFSNQIEIYWGVDRNDTELVSELKSYIRSNSLIPDAREETKALDWLVTNGKKYKWRLVGRTSTGSQQWWHWIYDPKIVPSLPKKEPSNTTLKNPIIVNTINSSKNDNFVEGSTKTIKMDLDESGGKWKFVLLDYSFTSDNEEGSSTYSSGIKSNGGNININIEDFIINELDLDSDDNNIKIRFKAYANPIINNKLDSNRIQIIKSSNANIKFK